MIFHSYVCLPEGIHKASSTKYMQSIMSHLWNFSTLRPAKLPGMILDVGSIASFKYSVLKARLFEFPWFQVFLWIPMRACQRSHSGTETNWMEKTKTSWRTTCLGNTHRIHGAAIYGNIYHQYTPFMLAYIYHTWILWDILKL